MTELDNVQRHPMPNGSEVFYRSSDHSYWRGYDYIKDAGKGRVMGISNIAKRGDGTNVDGLLDWAVRCEGDWREEQKAKGEVGLAAHDVLEYLSEGGEPLLTYTGHEKAVIDWWAEANPKPISAEMVVYSAERNFAGRFDLLAEIDGKRTILDLKTGSLRNAAAVQLNLYALGMADAGYAPPERLLILKTYDDGLCTPVEVPIEPKWAIHALAMENSCREIGRITRAGLKLRQQVAA